MFLEVSGYDVDVAHTMRDAMKRLTETKFDVMLCDLNLPDGNGWDLLAAVKQKSALPAIAFSAFDEPEHIARSKAAGFFEHVVKGVTPEELVAAIDRALRDGHAPTR